MSFDDFWSVYPRRIAKLAAKRKYEQALRHATEDEILAGAVAYSRVTATTEMQFIKHPATWLHGGCWDDDMSAVAPRRQPQQALRGAAALAEELRQEITNAGLGGSQGADHQTVEQLRLERQQFH